MKNINVKRLIKILFYTNKKWFIIIKFFKSFFYCLKLPIIIFIWYIIDLMTFYLNKPL